MEPVEVLKQETGVIVLPTENELGWKRIITESDVKGQLKVLVGVTTSLTWPAASSAAVG